MSDLGLYSCPVPIEWTHLTVRVRPVDLERGREIGIELLSAPLALQTQVVAIILPLGFNGKGLINS
jgi:hypothetical protein